MTVFVHISQALLLSSLSLSHTQADSFISMLMSHKGGLIDRILGADNWSMYIHKENPEVSLSSDRDPTPTFLDAQDLSIHVD